MVNIKGFGCKVLIILLLFGPKLCISQLAETATATDTTAVVQPAAIPVINIVQETAKANEALKLINRKIEPKNQFREIDSLFPQYALFVEDQKNYVAQFIQANPNRQKVDNLIKKWNGYGALLKNWEGIINQYEQRNSILLDEVNGHKQTWDLTLQNAILEKAPTEIVENARSVMEDFNRLKEFISEENNDFLKLESKINLQISSAENVIDELIALKNSKVYHLFYLRHKPLWNTSFKTPEHYKAENIGSESFSENLSGIRQFVKNNDRSIYLFLISIVLITLLIRYLRSYFIKYSFDETDGDLQKAKDIMMSHSWASILFLSLLASKLFLSATPRLFDDIRLFIVLIATLPLAQPYIHKRYKKICYFVIIFYLMDAAKTYVWFSSAQYRLYLLAEAFLVIGATYYFTHPYLQTLKLDIGKFGRQLIRISPVLYLLSAISIISNLLGYTNLTDLTLKICTQGSILTVILFGTLLIVKGISTSSIHGHYSRKGTYNADKKSAGHLKTLQILRVIAIICWVVIFLELIDVLRPLNDVLKDLLTEPYLLGSITFTIGTVITFILILGVSFLITSFISYLFDDADTGPLKILQLPKGVPAAISLVIRYFIIALGVILALSSLGIDLSKFNLMAGALGLGIGFGLQTVISNFISGIILVFERPILPGDTVEVNNLLGTVNRIGVRSSSISTFDGAEVIVPNNSLIANDLINWTLSNNTKRVEVLVGTSYDADPNQVLKILFDAASENENVLKIPAPQALFSEFGDSSLNFRLRFWVHYEVGMQTKSEVSIAVYNLFKEQGIEIPFPQRDVRIRELPDQTTNVSKIPRK